MDIKEFAQKHRLRLNDRSLADKRGLNRDAAVEDVILGKFGEVAPDSTYGPVFCVRILAGPRDTDQDTLLRSRMRRALDGGLRLKWQGHAESTFHFDPQNDAEAALVFQLAGIPQKRRVSEEQAEAFRTRMAAARVSLPCANSPGGSPSPEASA